RGGEEVAIKGRGFDEGTRVVFGDAAAAQVELVSGEEIRAVTPPATAGAVDLFVLEGEEDEDVLEKGFAFEPLDLRFVEVPPHAFPGMETLSIAAAVVGDFDMDADPDILVAVSGEESRLLLNNSAGNFTDSTQEGQEEDEADASEDEDAGVEDVYEDPAVDGEDAPADVEDVEEEEAVPVDPDSRLPGWTYDTRAVAVFDFDGDGDLDIFVCNGPDASNKYFANDGTAHFVNKTRDALPEDEDDCTAAVALDVDGDGKQDVVTANNVASVTEDNEFPQIRVYLNEGRGSGSPAEFEVDDQADIPQRSEVVASLAAADVNGDAVPDLVLSHLQADDGVTVRVLINRSGETAPDSTSSIKFTYAGADELPSPPGPVSHVAAGDVDGDGDVDIVALSTDGQDRLLVNDGSGHFFDDSFSSMPVDRVDGRFAALADMDMSGVSDIVIANWGAQNRLYLHRDPGDFIDKTPALPMHGDRSVVALVLDAEGDGDLDIVFINGGGDESRLYLSVEP
ncbi:MAG: FG-GAP-like repeat-containing protein, partial [Pseudomonadota bacterium]